MPAALKNAKEKSKAIAGKARTKAGQTTLDKNDNVTRTQNIIEQLRTLILEGTFAAGTHLTESQLSNVLKVSRTPIQQALRALSQEELLEYSPNRGYIIADFSNKDILDAYDVRGTLEGMGCRVCIENGVSDEKLAEIENILSESAKYFSGEKTELDWGRLNLDFHLAIVEGSGNKQLMSIAKKLRRIPKLFDARLAPNTSFFQSVYTVERRRQSHMEHCAIFDAIKAGQAARAEALMREHVYQNREALRRRLDEIEK